MKLSGLVYYYFQLALLCSAPAYANPNTETAILAGGCFWCMEADFDNAPGVLNVISGYTGGMHGDPTYDDYSSKGHIEAVKIAYDSTVISYEQLLEYFWIHIDPTDGMGQFCDRGREYSSAIFYLNDQQKTIAEASKRQLDQSGVLKKPVETRLIKAGKFYPAEEYHQDYYIKNPYSYKFYRYTCRRDHRLDQLWSDVQFPLVSIDEAAPYTKLAEADLEKQLTPLQYQVTQQDGTEPPFRNAYWNNTKQGIYVDVVSGEPLFSSLDKFKSGTGWPSFTKPLDPDNIVTREDDSWFAIRTEVRSKHADSHLGHVFNDGPEPTGLRYCMNSAAMRFIPKDDLAKEGYARYLELFEQ